MYDFILFDLDGTVTDSQEGIINCMKYALKNMGIDEQNYDNLKRFIGPPLIDGFMKYYNLTEIEAKRAIGFYREKYTAEGIFQNKLEKSNCNIDLDIFLIKKFIFCQILLYN